MAIPLSVPFQPAGPARMDPLREGGLAKDMGDTLVGVVGVVGISS